MNKIICLNMAGLRLEAELNDSLTAQEIWQALPFKAQVERWGEEIYFEIPVRTTLEDDYACDLVEKGDLGYWPQGACFCVFFGPTPASENEEIRPASAVNVFGRLMSIPQELRGVAQGTQIEIVKKG